MRIVVTGGAGFLGSHLCDLFLNEGHRVVCIDNFITGDMANIKHLQDNRDFEFIEHDVIEKIHIDGEFDYILHFACPASPVDFLRLSIQILKAGSLGTLNALELAIEKQAKFLSASSSEVYGDALINPQSEDYRGNVNQIGLRGVYDEAKRFSEALIMAYHRQHNLDTKIARIFNTYGPRMRRNDGRVVVTFITRSLANEPLTVFGDGSQTRSFCYVSDLIEGIYKLMLSDANDPVNLGNPEELTILELARKVRDVTESKSEIVFNPLPEDDPKLRRPDISRAQRLLAWNPKISLNEGLKKTAVWFSKLD